MTIDSKVIEAIYAAVENRNQPDKFNYLYLKI